MEKQDNELGFSVELHNASFAQTLYFNAVVMPDIIQLLQTHAENLEDIGKEGR